ncbi:MULTISPECIES: acetyl-CoA carboxylase biotin carboxyl carrier protein [Staphylococcus]|uniref:acetyl-CoA carboxylase biotin carboxyl carrier protein n=1 Tax=Staphylococcus sp. GDH8C109P TaxID=2804088 RepID=UPI001AEBE08D|nr:biotin/lipoyl-containing protein [Staphylococcus sp. GDH8C109P]
MNFEKVEQLIKIVKDNGVKKFNYKDYENEITIDFTDNTSAAPAQQQLASNDESSLNEQGISNEEQSTQAVKSPMVGTFYLQDEKELTSPLIREGDEIKKGDTIGYIEAMKVMNEVKSDVNGVVDAIHVNHGSNVEYDQTIITVK